MTLPTFIKAAEVWLPSKDGTLLELGSGYFGSGTAFGAISRSMCFGRCEGLPGAAWDEGRPILLRDLENSYFRRAAAARALGITCAVAIPYFEDERIAAVLVMFCAHAPLQGGAVELWRAPGGQALMALVDGAYGADAAEFEAMSRATSFERGAGLPGAAWSLGQALFQEDLGSASGAFLRGRAAAGAGLVRGLAIPAGSLDGEPHVLTFLAGSSLPLAHRVERWVPAQTGVHLRRVYAYSELHGGRSSAEVTLVVGRRAAPAAVAGDGMEPWDEPDGAVPVPHGALSQALLLGVPVINERPASEPGPPAAAATAIGAKALLAVPVVRDGVAEVLALYL
ncbi:MAG TPA: GAF domain-containing protein [Burkholderiales bacterium]|nr:GAF domain-containing protein [Burkholderiales bacterium]